MTLFFISNILCERPKSLSNHYWRSCSTTYETWPIHMGPKKEVKNVNDEGKQYDVLQEFTRSNYKANLSACRWKIDVNTTAVKSVQNLNYTQALVFYRWNVLVNGTVNIFQTKAAVKINFRFSFFYRIICNIQLQEVEIYFLGHS